MSDQLEFDPTKPDVEALRKIAVGHLQAAVDAILSMGPAAPSPLWVGKIERLRREISGERSVRMLHGSAVKLDPVGPVVGLNDWCDQMIEKINAFRAEYTASMLESPEHFPLERTAADWSQELSLFSPTLPPETSDDETEDQAAA